MFAGLWPGFDADEVPITSVTNGVHAPTWVAPRGHRPRRARTSVRSSSRTAAGWEAIERRRRRRRSGRVRRDLRARAGRGGPAPAARVVAAARRQCAPSSAGSTTSSTPTCSRSASPVGCRRTSGSPSCCATRSGCARCCSTRAAGPDRHRRQVAPGRRRRQAAHPAAGASSPTTRACGTGSCSCPTTTSAWPRYLYPGCDVWLNNPLRPLEACGTSGMKAALNGGLNLSDPRRLVGREVRRPERLGDPDRRRRRGPGPPRRPRGRRALRPDRELGRAALLRPRRRRAAARGGSRWCGTRCARSGPKVLASRMVRDYVHQLYAPAAASGRARRRTPLHVAAQRLAAWKQRVARSVAGVRVDHVEADGVGDAPAARAHPAAAGVRVARRAGAGRRRRRRSLYGRVDGDDRLIAPAALDAGGRGRVRGRPLALRGHCCRSTGPARSATRSGCCPSEPHLATPAEMNLVALPHTPGAMTEGDLR